MSRVVGLSCTATNGTVINDLQEELGPRWVTEGGGFTVHNNRIYPTGGGTTRCDGTLASADYDFSAVFRWLDGGGGLAESPDLDARRQDNGDAYYLFYEAPSSRIALYKWISATPTLLGSYTWTPTANVDYRLMLRLRGDQISGFLDGVEVIGPVTDTAITTPGTVSIYGYGAVSTTTGWHLRDLLVETPAATEYFKQSFTGTNGASVEADPPEVGVTLSGGDGTPFLIHNNRAYGPDAVNFMRTSLLQTLPKNYEALVTVRRLTTGGTNEFQFVVRRAYATGYCYAMNYVSGVLSLDRESASFLSFGSMAWTPTLNTDYEFKIRCEGSRISAWLDGVELFHGFDTTFVEGGLVGVVNDDVASSTTTGFHFRDLIVRDVRTNPTQAYGQDFTGSSGTSLADLTPQVGTGNLVLPYSGAIVRNNKAAFNNGAEARVPWGTQSDYRVRVNVMRLSASPEQTMVFKVRRDATTNDSYYVTVTSALIRLWYHDGVADVETEIGSGWSWSPILYTEYVFDIEARGDELRVWCNGYLTHGALVDTTLAGPGQPVIAIYDASSSTDVGWHYDLLEVYGEPDDVPPQTLEPASTVSSTDWTASSTTLHGDTSDGSDATYASATAYGAEMLLTLASPSPMLDPILTATLLVRLRATSLS